MEHLAERYAKLKGTKVIASWLHENSITFVLESGPKLTMSTRQLEEAIAELKADKKIVATIQEIAVSPEISGTKSAPQAASTPPATALSRRKAQDKKKGTPSE